MNRLELIYESIKDVEDKHTRRILYIQFIMEYYPECYDAIILTIPER